MTASPEIAIPVHDLDAAGKAFRLPIRAAWLRHALEGTDVAATGEDGELDVRLSKSAHDVVVRGGFRVKVRVPCARCLEPAEVVIAEPLTALAVQDARSDDGPHGDDRTDVADEPDSIVYDGETVVLDDLLRDEILLAVPMIPLCSESCTGISLQARAAATDHESESIDPRLQPLLKLKK